MDPNDWDDGDTVAWERQAKHLVRGELMRRGISHERLVVELASLGVAETVPNLRNKLARGRFTMVWFLQLMAAMRVEFIRLPAPPGTPSGDAIAAEGGAQILARGPKYDATRKRSWPPRLRPPKVR